ncbi:MAG: signal peptidase I [Clostridia bacterium]|nr:signal peptidase I [Clostridia bacterium]
MSIKKETQSIKAEGVANEQVEKKPTKKSKVLNTVINVVLVIAILLAIMATYVSYVSTSGSGVPSILGLRLFSIQTDSMYDTLMPGDLVVDTAVKDPATLKPQDIITYWTVIDGERVLNTHRIVEIYDGNGYLIFATKGDNNTTVDTLTVHEAEIVGKYSFRIPGVGKVFDYLQTSTGFLIVVVIPVLIFLLYQLIQFFRVLFEYQNVKSRIRFEQERGRTEDLIEEQKSRDEAAKQAERERLEAELREKIRAEMMEQAKKEAESASADSEKSE